MIPALSFSAIGRLVGDHLWQSTLFAAVAALLTLTFRNHRAEVRNGLWLAASVKFLIPFAALVAIGNHLGWRRAAPPAPHPASFVIDMDAISQPFSRLAAGTLPTAASHSAASVVPILLLAVWGCGFAAILLTWWTRWRRVAVTVREASPIQKGPEVDALRRLEAIVGITKPLALVSSNSSLEPGVFGITRPVLLWPPSIAERLSDVHVEMILAHELSHVRRRDNLAAAIHMLVEALFWFHPLVWWLGARMVEERERACDENVLRLGCEPQLYAESVLKVCEFYLESPIVCVAGVTASNLKKRMERIMSNHAREALNTWRKLFLATAGLAALAVPLVAGALANPSLHPQASTASTAGYPAFSEAYITPSAIPKPGEEGRSRSRIELSPTSLTISNADLTDCLEWAYGVEFYQLSGLQLDPRRYDILAKTADPVSPNQLRLMLQQLLAERFRLALHRDTETFPVYALTIAKGGAKLPAAKGDGEVPPNHVVESLPLVQNGSFVFNETSMPEFAEKLSLLRGIDRPVLDNTQIKGVFDITLRSAAMAVLQDHGPSLSTFLDEQLGLTLEPQTRSLEILIVDRIEEPSPN